MLLRSLPKALIDSPDVVAHTVKRKNTSLPITSFTSSSISYNSSDKFLYRSRLLSGKMEIKSYHCNIIKSRRREITRKETLNCSRKGNLRLLHVFCLKV